MSNSRDRFFDAQNWSVGSADIKNVFHQMRIPGWLQEVFFALSAVLVSDVGYVQPRTSCSRFLNIPCSCNTSLWVLLGRCFSVKMSRTTARSREVLIILSLFVVTTPNHRCSVANVAWHPVASDGLMLTIMGFWLAVRTALTFISHVSLQVYKKAGLDVHHISRASGSADVLGYEVSPVNACCSGTSKRISRIRSVARTVSRRRILGRAMQLVNGHGSFLALSNRGVLNRSLMPASKLHGRPTRFQENHGQLCVWSKEHLVGSYVFSEVIRVFAGLMSASDTDSSEKAFACGLRRMS